MRLICLVFISTALLVAPAFAQASGSSDRVRAVPVRYADLDLSRTDGASALMSRLRRAATTACEPVQPPRLGPAARRAVERCRTEALNAAVAEVDEPVFTRLYEERRR